MRRFPSIIKEYLKKNNNKIDIDTIAELLDKDGLGYYLDDDYIRTELLNYLVSQGAIIGDAAPEDDLDDDYSGDDLDDDLDDYDDDDDGKSRYGVDDDDLKAQEEYINKVTNDGISDKEIEEAAKYALDIIADVVSDKDYFKKGYDAYNIIDNSVQDAFINKWPYAGEVGARETPEAFEKRLDTEAGMYDRILSSIINKLSTLNIPASEYDKFEQAAKLFFGDSIDPPKEKSANYSKDDVISYLLNDDNEFINDMIKNYLDKYHPDMSVAQWKNNADDKEKINFNRWFNKSYKPFDDAVYDASRHINSTKVDDNGHKDYYSDRTLKNIISTLSDRLL